MMHIYQIQNFRQYSLLIYYAAWIRCTIYIMGLLVGYFMQHVKKLKINWMINLALWALSISLMLTVLLGLRNYMNGDEVSLFWRAMYSALSRPAWGLGLTWIIVSCYYGYGGILSIRFDRINDNIRSYQQIHVMEYMDTFGKTFLLCLFITHHGIGLCNGILSRAVDLFRFY